MVFSYPSDVQCEGRASCRRWAPSSAISGTWPTSPSRPTSRILNLALVHTLSVGEEDYASRPFFTNPKLNKAIIIKHTLRPNELELFRKVRRTATKIILPFDTAELRIGGESMFVGQAGFEKSLLGLYGGDAITMQRDLDVLHLLDVLPSLDPFIVREAMARRGFAPAPCYLKISANDISNMIAFANDEIARLVGIAFADTKSAAALRFTGKILSDDIDNELDPLKATLRLSQHQFAEGIFSWRGFLYFKWRYLDLQSELRRVIEALAKYQPAGFPDNDLRDLLQQVRPRLARRILAALGNVGRIIAFYDDAYRQLIEGQNPVPFREFLLEGPKMFYELGEHVGILTHIASFWAYRVGNPRAGRLSVVDYADTLLISRTAWPGRASMGRGGSLGKTALRS